MVGLLGSTPLFLSLNQPSSRNQESSPSFSRPRYQVQNSRTKFKNQDQERKEANEPKYFQPTVKRGQVTHQKCLVVQPLESFNLSTTGSHPLAMFTMHTPPAPPVPLRFPPKGSILSPAWTHAITTIMGQPLSSESGKSIQKWILYHVNQDPIEVWLYRDPTDPYDIKLLLLLEYVGSNGSVVYLPSSTIKSLISLWNYMNVLINKENLLMRNAMPNIFSKMINGSI